MGTCKRNKVKVEERAPPDIGEHPEPIANALHPLQIGLVLKTVFKYSAQPNEVRRNRLVCRAWHDASKPQWATIKMLTVFLKDDDMKRAGGGGETCITLKQLRTGCRNSPDSLEVQVPFQNFKLYGWKFFPELNVTLPDSRREDVVQRGFSLQWFWATIAPNLVTKLTLDKCELDSIMMVFKPAFLSSFPNLQKYIVWDSILDEWALKSLNVKNSTLKLERANSALRAHLRLLVQEGDLQAEDLGNLLEDAVGGDEENPPPSPSAQYLHQNLRSVTVKAWCRAGEYSTQWCPFLKHVPKLEFLRVCAPDKDDGADWEQFLSIFVDLDLQNVAESLKHLDVLDFSSAPFSRGVLSLYEASNSADFPSMEVFKYDIGFKRGSLLRETGIICRRMKNLEKLFLYHAPLGAPVKSFLINAEMDSLRELYLWGVFSPAMDFLGAVPNLEVLVWTTSAYDEEHKGKRLFQMWTPERVIYPFCNYDFVGETVACLVLPKLTRLEVDWTPKSPEHWKKLWNIMPNLRNLKILVTSQEQLLQVRQHWKGLQSLELAHGSVANGTELIEALTKFENLREFVWKGCLCTQQQVKMEDISGLVEKENLLKMNLPSLFQFPWHLTKFEKISRALQKDPRLSAAEEAKLCVRGKYEKALATQNPLEYTGN